ncbi:MAG: hypothetical protein AB7G06_01315 [Bdellovibrionales bacterium]
MIGWRHVNLPDKGASVLERIDAKKRQLKEGERVYNQSCIPKFVKYVTLNGDQTAALLIDFANKTQMYGELRIRRMLDDKTPRDRLKGDERRFFEKQLADLQKEKLRLGEKLLTPEVGARRPRRTAKPA